MTLEWIDEKFKKYGINRRAAIFARICRAVGRSLLVVIEGARRLFLSMNLACGIHSAEIGERYWSHRERPQSATMIMRLAPTTAQVIALGTPRG